jgi:dTDP-4-amino-4,6-dideoxygalactose transaminase
MSSIVPFNDFTKEYQSIREKILAGIQEVLDSGYFILGKQVRRFEKKFADYIGTKFCVGCASGTEAIALSLMALDIGQGDSVVTVPNTAVPTVSAISMVGARPLFVDVDDNTYNMDPNKLEYLIKRVARDSTLEVKAILPVHLYGEPCDINSIMEVSHTFGIPVIEDACQAHGAAYITCAQVNEKRWSEEDGSNKTFARQEKRVGSFGSTGCFSFYPTKNLGCYGDGGAITTNSKGIYERLLMLRNYGQSDRYHHDIKGINSRLDEIQAAILTVKIDYLNAWNKRRNEISYLYNRFINHYGLSPNVSTPYVPDNVYHVYHLYVIKARQRDELREYLAKNGIQTLFHYPIPVHLQKAYADLGYRTGDFPITEKSAKQILSLPIHWTLEDKQVEYICTKIKSFYHS